MTDAYIEIAIRIAGAWAAGSLIGLERSFHGRPAGFRTHALVCGASALLMQVTVFQSEWLGPAGIETVRSDPTRLAQGIMTGIGFLGAGVIFKEGLTVRGLTTAASIWITAALGILYGVGLLYPAAAATLAVLATLAAFRWIEDRLPSQFYAHHLLRFAREEVIPEAEVRKLLGECGFSIANMSYRLTEGGTIFEYRMVIRTSERENAEKLAQKLRSMAGLREFRIAPAGD